MTPPPAHPSAAPPPVEIAVVLGGVLSIPPQGSSPVFRHVLFVDAGIHFQSALRLPPPRGIAAWIGDGDSSGPAGQDAWEKLRGSWERDVERLDFCTRKDFSDFGGALDFLSRRLGPVPLSLHVFAGLGGRSDHELINLLEAREFAAARDFPVRFFFHPNVFVSNSPLALSSPPGAIFSLVARSYPSRVRIEGAEFEGELQLARPSHGLSNRAQDPVSLTPLDGAVLTVYFEGSASLIG